MGSAFEQFRLAELADTEALLREFVGQVANVLEIGSGTGWQARALAERGFSVTGVDLPASSAISNHARTRVWPIVDYDGVHLPFPDGHFDAVYSSNVLEHVTDLDALNAEMLRVLRPGGIGLHLLPNPQWRVLSLFSYYPGQVADALRILRRRIGRSDTPATVTASGDTAQRPRASLATRIAQRLLPPAHGAVGTPLGEISRYSRRQWDSFFSGHGWRIVRYGNNGLIASGDYLLGRALPIAARRKLGKLLGGIAHVYVLTSERGNG
jgi:SAM-dependent methyltransferase